MYYHRFYEAHILLLVTYEEIRNLQYHLLNGGINNIDRVEEAEYICLLAKENADKKFQKTKTKKANLTKC